MSHQPVDKRGSTETDQPGPSLRESASSSSGGLSRAALHSLRAKWFVDPVCECPACNFLREVDALLTAPSSPEALKQVDLPADAAKVMRDNIWQLIGVESAFGFEQQKNAELTARLHALTGYVQHKPDCDQWMGDTFCGVTFSQPQLNPKRACTCGLADLLTPASAEEPEKR